MSQEDKDIYKLVQDGYNEVAESFFKLKDSTFDRLEIFHEFTQLIQNSKINFIVISFLLFNMISILFK